MVPTIIDGGDFKSVHFRLTHFPASTLINSMFMKVKGKLVSKPYVSAACHNEALRGFSDHRPDMLEYYIKNTRYQHTKFDVPSNFRLPTNTCPGHLPEKR